jgi:2-polyprenyl-3-methyl-5-hydroxy-6-metoxy-1,4-benzoquinol methylase
MQTAPLLRPGLIMAIKNESKDSSEIISKQFNAFIDFYNRHNVIPVSQDTKDLEEFIFRRNYLYTKLGVPLSFFKNRSVLEFGPGGGFNALATAFYKPELYVFVDASTQSLSKLHHHKQSGKFNANKVEIINSTIFDYRDSRKYDYVIVEGVICGQAEPDRMMRHVSSFIGDSGALITTTTSATSVLSEICRKLLRIKIVEQCPTFESQVAMGASIFKTHLKSLGTSTRPINDWVIDVILNDWEKGHYTFGLNDVVESIGNEFDFYNSSPSFTTDDRWYKKVTNKDANLNSLLVEQYTNLAAFFIDYRVPLTSILKIKANISETEKLSRLACDAHDDIMRDNSYDKLNEFFRILQEIKKSLPDQFNLTTLAIEDFISTLPKFINDSKKSEFTEFSKWWGRGQQYASFLKRAY